jgi:hypothetical protein
MYVGINLSRCNSVYHSHMHWPVISGWSSAVRGGDERSEPWLTFLLLGKLSGLQLVKKFPAFLEPKGSLPHSQVPPNLSLSRANSIHSIPPHPTSWRSILILSSHLPLGVPSGDFRLGLSTKTLYAPLLSPIRAICPTHLTFLDFITLTIVGEEYSSLSSSLCSFLHSLVKRSNYFL